MPLANEVLLRRHESSLFDNKLYPIGHHAPHAKALVPASPLSSKDVTLLARAVQEQAQSHIEAKEQGRWLQHDSRAIVIRGKTLDELRLGHTDQYMLGRDRFGLLVQKDFRRSAAPKSGQKPSAKRYAERSTQKPRKKL